MSVNITLMNVLVYVSTILKNQRLLINNMEPGLRMGNNVLGSILCPPFTFRWNRHTLTQDINNADGTDYEVSWPSLGWIETQWLEHGEPGDSDYSIVQINGAQSIAKTTMSKPPSMVAPVYDDNEGNVTIRFDAVPDQDYTAYFDYQASATLLTSPASTFGPIPDQFSFLYTKWMLAEGALLVGDSRRETFLRDAVYSLLAMQDGMTEQQKAIMAQQLLNNQRTDARSVGMTQLGLTARNQQ